MEKSYQDREVLQDLVNEGLSEEAIAVRCDCSVGTIRYWKQQLGITKASKRIKILRELTAEQIDEDIEKAGGVGQWAQRKMKERYAKHEYLANLYMKEGKLDKASYELDKGDKLLTELSPSRSKINPEKPNLGPTSDDHKVLKELNKLIDNVKEDMNFTKEDSVIEDAWGKRVKLASIQSEKDNVNGLGD